MSSSRPLQAVSGCRPTVSPFLKALVRLRVARWACAAAALLALLLPAVGAGANCGAPSSYMVAGDRPLASAANPAAVYCKLLGYGYETVTTDRGQEGICILPDGRRVDAWAFFRGTVAPEYSYCARHGYRTEVVDLGDGTATAECAVCKDQQGNVVGTAADLIGLDQAAGLEAPVPPGSTPSEPVSPGSTPTAPVPAAPAAPVAEPEGRSLPGRAGTQGSGLALPSSFDWRQQNGCTPIKDQGGCGSCWAFSTVAPLECNILIKDHVVEDLSEQWLVSCNQDGWSCGGGQYAHNYHIWKTDPCGGTGPVLERDFPYAAEDLPCSCPYPHQAQYIPESWAYMAPLEFPC